MYVNLELSVNEEFVAFGTMVKILTILKSNCAKGCHLLQKLEPVTGRVYLPQCCDYKFLFPKLGLLKTGPILDFLSVRQSDNAPIGENYVKLYFDAKHLGN